MSAMNGKICVVTGATQGLGAAIARRLALGGAGGVITAGRNTPKGEARAAAITEETGVPVRFVTAELGSVEDCRRVIAEADSRFGTLHALVNAGAITDRGNILNTTPELFDRMFAVNTRAPFFLIQEAVRVMIRDGIAGSIVNIGSISERTGQPFLTAYAASKGALATLTRNTAFALLRNRIRVNQLDIGWMASDHERELQARETGDPDWEARAAAQLPNGRLIDPDEVARMTAFLISDESGLITGSVIDYDQSVLGGTAGAMPAPDAPLTV